MVMQMSKRDDVTQNWQTATVLAQALHGVDQATGGVVPALQPSTTFVRDKAYQPLKGHIYSRYTTPNLTGLEQIVARIEGGPAALCFSSGLAAITTLLESLPTGSRIVAPEIMYFAALDWMKHLDLQGRIKLDLFNPDDNDDLARVLADKPADLVWIEPAVNPTWTVIGIEESARLAHQAGARLAVDATVTPPVTTKPLELGADYVMHSGTKYLNGHSDVLSGVLVPKKCDDQWDKIVFARGMLGNPLAPFEAWLMIRGLRTLGIRFIECSRNALIIARHFENHPRIETILYPGLVSHPGHAIAAHQCKNGFGGMMSILVRDGSFSALQVVTRLKIFLPATSLGGVESLVEHRKTVEGENSPTSEKLLRLSIGIEAVEDLIADLEQALG